MMAARHDSPLRPPSRYTQAQEFFIGYAQVWCSKYRPEFSRTLAQSDPHSPPWLRVNLPLRNMREFQEAFECPDDARMVLPQKDRCEVW